MASAAAGMFSELQRASNLGSNDMVQHQESSHVRNTDDKKTSMPHEKPEPHLRR